MGDPRAWAPEDPLCIAPSAARLEPVIRSHAHLAQIEADHALKSADLLACRRSPWYWIVNHCVTLDEHDPDEPYKRFPAWPHLQATADLWWWCGVRYPGLLLPKSRKQMITWLISLLFFGEAQFVTGKRNLVQSYKEDESTAIVAKMRGVWSRQPPWIRQPAVWTTTEVRFANDSVFKAVPGGPEQLQGPTLSGYFGNEEGDIPDPAETFEATIPAVGMNGRIVLEGRCPRGWWHDVLLADKLGA